MMSAKPRTKTRLDTLLVERGLAVSRERAQALILAGRVQAGGSIVAKPGSFVPEDVRLELIEPDHPYVGRGGVKLAHALEVFDVQVRGRDALDIGAATGGFTDALLKLGAARVLALDVGHGQFDWTLRHDPRVVVIEGVNARTLTPALLPPTFHRFDIVTIDVSFISLRHILPVVPPLLKPAADVIPLVKPQFEAGRAEVGKKGIVRDPDVHTRVVQEISAVADQVGLSTVATAPSPITGAEGNREFFLHLRQKTPISFDDSRPKPASP